MINTGKTLLKWAVVYGAILGIAIFTGMEFTFFDGITSENWIWIL